MDSWERFNETSLPDKKYFYSKLNLEDISDKDYSHAQKVFEEFCVEMGDYHDLNVQCDTLFLADVFEKFRDTCVDIYVLDPSYFLYAPDYDYMNTRLRKETKSEFDKSKYE